MNDYVKLHLSVLLSGLTGVLGKLISLSEGMLVFYRLWFAFIIFAFMLFLTNNLPKENFKSSIKIMGIGALLGAHFLLFFASIKYANVSVGVVCYSLVGFFTVIFEPLIEKTRFSLKDFCISLLAVMGILLIFNFDSGFRIGILLGVLSSAVFALYTIFNKTVSKDTKSLLFYELLGGSIFMSAVVPFYIMSGAAFIPLVNDFWYLFILAFFCTIGLYILHIQVLKTLSPFTVSLCGNLEPVYGILFAMFLTNEVRDLNLMFYLGLMLIILSIVFQSFGLISNKRKCKTNNSENYAKHHCNVVGLQECRSIIR